MREQFFYFMMSIGQQDKWRETEWGNHAPGKPCTDTISEVTKYRISKAIADGATRIVMGNTCTEFKRLRARNLAQINSRYHGRKIRTVTAYWDD